jgi:glyoxylase I family protein
MLHHIDVHVRDLTAASAFFDALAEHVGYRRRVDPEPDFVGYERCDAGRPRIGFTLDPAHRAGTMRIAFAVATREQVDAAARAAVARGARGIEGPSLNPEYGDDYYAVFFEDPDGNRYEVLVDAPAVRPKA